MGGSVCGIGMGAGSGSKDIAGLSARIGSRWNVSCGSIGSECPYPSSTSCGGGGLICVSMSAFVILGCRSSSKFGMKGFRWLGFCGVVGNGYFFCFWKSGFQARSMGIGSKSRSGNLKTTGVLFCWNGFSRSLDGLSVMTDSPDVENWKSLPFAVGVYGFGNRCVGSRMGSRGIGVGGSCMGISIGWGMYVVSCIFGIEIWSSVVSSSLKSG